jgi:hypothetical protein
MMIRREIAALPADQRAKALAFQMGLDRERDADPEGFAPSLWARLNENIKNIEDQFFSIKHLIVGPPEVKHVNLFGYNPKYGVSGRRIVGVRYEPQSFSKGLTRPEQTLPARVARR